MSLTLTAPPTSQATGLRTTAAAAAPSAKRRLDATRTGPDIVEVWGLDSFPASDPPANW
jgi:hypothetical protein